MITYSNCWKKSYYWLTCVINTKCKHKLSNWCSELTCIRAQIKYLPIIIQLPGSYFLNKRGRQLITASNSNQHFDQKHRRAERGKQEEGKSQVKWQMKCSGTRQSSLMYNICTYMPQHTSAEMLCFMSFCLICFCRYRALLCSAVAMQHHSAVNWAL